jgi:hypothetical protein
VMSRLAEAGSPSARDEMEPFAFDGQ